MTRQESADPSWRYSNQSWAARLISSPARCHALGGILSFGLIALNAWIWTDSHELGRDGIQRQSQLSVSAELIASESHHKRQLETANRQKEFNKVRIDQIRSWLPSRREWGDVRSSLQALCDETNLQLVSIKQATDLGGEQAGTHVTILAGQCEVQGSYLDIFRFVRHLTQLEHPMSCSAIEITERDTNSTETSETDEVAKCHATISVRAPMIGNGTTAETLLGTNHGNSESQPASIELSI